MLGQCTSYARMEELVLLVWEILVHILSIVLALDVGLWAVLSSDMHTLIGGNHHWALVEFLILKTLLLDKRKIWILTLWLDSTWASNSVSRNLIVTLFLLLLKNILSVFHDNVLLILILMWFFLLRSDGLIIYMFVYIWWLSIYLLTVGHIIQINFVNIRLIIRLFRPWSWVLLRL